MGQIRKYFMFINEQMIAMAEDNDYIGFVPATGLAANPDNLHFSAKALREFDVRYYEEFRKLEDPNKVFLEKPSPDEAFRTDLELL